MGHRQILYLQYNYNILVKTVKLIRVHDRSIYLVSNDRVRWRLGHQAAGELAPEQGDPGHGELWTNLAARPHQPAQSGIYGGE